MNNDTMINEIRLMLPKTELLTTLAEEASELAQAALKLRRAFTKVNPTPVSAEKAIESLAEECADVLLAMRVLGLVEQSEIDRISDAKLNRWYNRLSNGIETETEKEDTGTRYPVVGDTLYWACHNLSSGYHISTVKVAKIYKSPNAHSPTPMILLNDGYSYHGVRVDEFGRTLFFEPSNAEKALAEMKQQDQMKQQNQKRKGGKRK